MHIILYIMYILHIYVPNRKYVKKCPFHFYQKKNLIDNLTYFSIERITYVMKWHQSKTCVIVQDTTTLFSARSICSSATSSCPTWSHSSLASRSKLRSWRSKKWSSTRFRRGGPIGAQRAIRPFKATRSKFVWMCAAVMQSYKYIQDSIQSKCWYFPFQAKHS